MRLKPALLVPALVLSLGLFLGGSPAVADEGEGQKTESLDELGKRIAELLQAAEALERAGLREQARDTWRLAGELYRTRLLPRLAGEAAAETPVDARDSVAAIQAANRWLVAHQSATGQWEAAGFGNWCDGEARSGVESDGAGKSVHDVGVTGLALSALIKAGHDGSGVLAEDTAVRKGLRWLAQVQDPDGCFGPRSTPNYMYGHAWASLAVVEAYARTRSPIYRNTAVRAVEFILQARNPYMAWRYGVRPGDNDTSVSGHMMRVLAAVRRINEGSEDAVLPEDDGAWEGLRNWISKMTDPDYGRVGYIQRGTGSARTMEMVDKFPAEKSEAMTAIGILVRLHTGEPADSQMVVKGRQLLERLPPVWNASDGSIDMMHWYWGTLAMGRLGGEPARRWMRALDKAVVASQRRDGTPCELAGSWDPIGPWGVEGGRVYSTALLSLTLQTAVEHAAGR